LPTSVIDNVTCWESHIGQAPDAVLIGPEHIW